MCMALALVGSLGEVLPRGFHNQRFFTFAVLGTTGGSKVAHMSVEPMSLAYTASRSFGIANMYNMLPEVLGQQRFT